MRIYQAKQPVDRSDKYIFDALSTGLILGLGLNFFEVFKDLAKSARWRILSSRFFEVREVVLILGAESLIKVFQLMTQSVPKSTIFLICLVWLLVNIGAQILVASLPLFASLQSGYNSGGVTVSQGYVAVPKLDCFYHSNATACGENEVDQYPFDATIAHAYGKRRASRDQSCSYQSIDDINQGPQACFYFTREDHREFAVRYVDSNPADLTNAYPYYRTQRIVTTAATNCNGSFNVAAPSVADSADGKESEFVWQFENSTGTYPLSIPRSILAAQSTTYVWNGTDLPPLATWQTCGPRCIVLYALRDFWRDSTDHEISIFQCRITISPMSNIKDPAHVLSDSIARTAAASIALSGRRRNDDSAWRNFQLYQDGAEWAATIDGSPEDVGALMAEFAASALATMAQQNPTTIVQGSLPTLGYQADVEWKNAGALAASIVAAHLLMVSLILWLTWSVIVMDDNFLVRVSLDGLVQTVPEGDELQLLPRTELAREPENTIRAVEETGEGAEEDGAIDGDLSLPERMTPHEAI